MHARLAVLLTDRLVSPVPSCEQVSRVPRFHLKHPKISFKTVKSPQDAKGCVLYSSSWSLGVHGLRPLKSSSPGFIWSSSLPACSPPPPSANTAIRDVLSTDCATHGVVDNLQHELPPTTVPAAAPATEARGLAHRLVGGLVSRKAGSIVDPFTPSADIQLIGGLVPAGHHTCSYYKTYVNSCADVTIYDWHSEQFFPQACPPRRNCQTPESCHSWQTLLFERDIGNSETLERQRTIMLVPYSAKPPDKD
ncbi:hypothetical protein B0H19DRAFT_1080483 [Mycena capillaripes]|nr:hypothetical protein B0H19DRAFT_1080483 [Mycena capillaripes]